jgi:hypothetical protein
VSWLKDIPEAHRDNVKLLILENLDLRERLRLERIEKYGPAAERLSDAQLELLELEPGVNAGEVEAEAQRGQLQLPLKTKTGDRKPRIMASMRLEPLAGDYIQADETPLMVQVAWVG